MKVISKIAKAIKTFDDTLKRLSPNPRVYGFLSVSSTILFVWLCFVVVCAIISFFITILFHL